MDVLTKKRKSVLLDNDTHKLLISTQIYVSAKIGKKMPLVEIINYLCADWQKKNK
jgi:hypothetical protein